MTLAQKGHSPRMRLAVGAVGVQLLVEVGVGSGESGAVAGAAVAPTNDQAVISWG